MADTSMEWLTDEELEELLSKPGAALIVFMAQWCQPCQTLKPRLDRLSSHYSTRLSCYLVDADQYPASAQKYGVRGLPTLVLLVDGNLEATRVGALDDEQLQVFVDAAL